MEWQKLKQKAVLLKCTAESILNANVEPCVKANARTILAHVRLLYQELGLDVDETE